MSLASEGITNVSFLVDGEKTDDNHFRGLYLRNKFDVLSVHEIMNTSGLTQSK